MNSLLGERRPSIYLNSNELHWIDLMETRAIKVSWMSSLNLINTQFVEIECT